MHRPVLGALVVFALSGCVDDGPVVSPEAPHVAASLLAASDAEDGGFYFLPPLAAQPEATGTFDAEAQPEVAVCRIEADACVEQVAFFDTSGQGSERVRANGSDGHYIVNWDTRDSGLQDGEDYRIAVSAEGVLLGTVDARAVRKGKDLKDAEEAGLFGLLIGRTVPIRFRIEVGAIQVPTARVVGVLSAVGGGAIAGATVTLEGTAVFGTSNSAGGVTLEGVRSGRRAVLRIASPSYLDQIVQLDIPDGVERVTFRATLTAAGSPVTVSASSGGTAEADEGAAVTIPAAGFRRADGTPVSGDIQVTITPLDVSGDEVEAFPGSYTGINSNGDPGLLMTYGLAEFDFRQNGEELQLAPGETAEITIPIYTGTAGLSLGDQIPLWYLDESTGDWIEESVGTVIALAASPTGLGLRGEVTHFSWWNVDVWVDAPYEPLVRCEADGAPVDCVVRASVSDPSFPRSNAHEVVPAAGARLTFPSAPVETILSGESGNRFGTYPTPVSGPAGGGANDELVIDLTESGVISADHTVAVLADTLVSVPQESIVVEIEGRDASGAPMTVGGFQVVTLVYFDSGPSQAVLAADNGDGTYTATLIPVATGPFLTRTRINNDFLTTGEPVGVVELADGAARGATSALADGNSVIAVGDTAWVVLQAREASGKKKQVGGDRVAFAVPTGGPAASAFALPAIDNGDGTYTGPIVGTSPGSQVVVTATINTEPVENGAPTIAVGAPPMTDVRMDSLLADGFVQWWSSTNFGMGLVVSTGSDTHSTSWGNWGMRDFGSEPRTGWNNDPSYSYNGTLLRFWNRNYAAASRALDVVQAIDGGFQLASGAADTERARVAALFLQGLAHGNLALFVDQAFILDASLDLTTDAITLRPYAEVMDSAVAYLDAARSAAEATTFTLPAHWINGEALTSNELAALAHSYQARFLASVARTETERQSVDWSAVMAHAQQGLNRNFAPLTQWTAGAWWSLEKTYGSFSGWSRADMRLVGGVAPNDPETDPDGLYAQWLATPVQDRQAYDLNTADRRVTDGTPTGSGAYVTYLGFSPFPANRGTYHYSNYMLERQPLPTFDDAPMATIGPVEMDLLEAEARYRLGLPGAAALVNQTRVGVGQLSPASDGDADFFDKLAYEKRMESWWFAPELNWFDRRGFGPRVAPNDFGHGLVVGTAEQFPVPGRELVRLGLPIYSYGGGSSLMMSSVVAGSSGAGSAVPASSVYRGFDGAADEVARPARPVGTH